MPQQKKPPVIQTRQLTINREGVTVLSDISWQVMHGQHWVVLGGNGSGKTSLLNALTGYLTPSHGDIDLLGKRYGKAHWPSLRHKIGIVSSSLQQMIADDEPALETIVTGKHAMIGMWAQPSPKDRRQATRLLRQIGCSNLAARRWAVLSQGERQRILIGRALIGTPRLLILDEPCAGLDPSAREQFLQFIDRLASHRNSPTLLLVTHHVEEITPAYTHVLLLRDGKVVAQGEKRIIMCPSLIQKTFNGIVKLRKRGNLYWLEVQARQDLVT